MSTHSFPDLLWQIPLAKIASSCGYWSKILLDLAIRKEKRSIKELAKSFVQTNLLAFTRWNFVIFATSNYLLRWGTSTSKYPGENLKHTLRSVFIATGATFLANLITYPIDIPKVLAVQRLMAKQSIYTGFFKHAALNLSFRGSAFFFYESLMGYLPPVPGLPAPLQRVGFWFFAALGAHLISLPLNRVLFPPPKPPEPTKLTKVLGWLGREATSQPIRGSGWRAALVACLRSTISLGGYYEMARMMDAHKKTDQVSTPLVASTEGVKRK